MADLAAQHAHRPLVGPPPSRENVAVVSCAALDKIEAMVALRMLPKAAELAQKVTKNR